MKHWFFKICAPLQVCDLRQYAGGAKRGGLLQRHLHPLESPSRIHLGWQGERLHALLHQRRGCRASHVRAVVAKSVNVSERRAGSPSVWSARVLLCLVHVCVVVRVKKQQARSISFLLFFFPASID